MKISAFYSQAPNLLSRLALELTNVISEALWLGIMSDEEMLAISAAWYDLL